MADFTLDSSTLGGAQFTTVFVRSDGEFQDLQVRCTQSATGQDMEVHWIEMHLTLGGVTEE